MVSFRGARKLSSYSVRAKVSPFKHKSGLWGCEKKRSRICCKVIETHLPVLLLIRHIRLIIGFIAVKNVSLSVDLLVMF